MAVRAWSLPDTRPTLANSRKRAIPMYPAPRSSRSSITSGSSPLAEQVTSAPSAMSR
jgi:hypothetical protein